MAPHAIRWSVVALLGACLGCSSGASGARSQPQGDEGGPCYPNGTCNGQLQCASRICVDSSSGGGGSSSGGAGSVATGGSPAESDGVTCNTSTMSDGRKWCKCVKSNGLASDVGDGCNVATFGGARCFADADSCSCEQYGCGQRVVAGGPLASDCHCGSELFLLEEPACPPGFSHFCYDPTIHTCVAQNGVCPDGNEELSSCDASVVVPKLSTSPGFTADCRGYAAALPDPVPPGAGGTSGVGSGGATAGANCKALYAPCNADHVVPGSFDECCVGYVSPLRCDGSRCLKAFGEQCSSDGECASNAKCTNGLCTYKPPACDRSICSGCVYADDLSCCDYCELDVCRSTCD